MEEKLLVVDDSGAMLRCMKEWLEDRYTIYLSNSGSKAVEALRRKEFCIDLLLLDVQMPGMNGYEVIDLLKADAELNKIPVIFLTGENSEESEVKCFQKGAVDFITKPLKKEVVINRIQRTLELERLRKNLEHEVRQKTKENEELMLQAIQAIANTIDAKDPYTNGHSIRVAMYSRLIALEIGLDQEAGDNIYRAALLHDIGKIAVPDSILNKPGRLTDEEFEVMKQHTLQGGKILQAIKSIDGVAIGAMYHHEKYDGTGYPNGLKADEIPEIARIICVADAYDAMNSNRVYRTGRSLDYVRAELVRCNGTQFDPVCATALLMIMDREEKLLEEIAAMPYREVV